MMNDQIEENREKNTSYTNYVETDSFALSGSPVFSVLDFWRYCYGDLASQNDIYVFCLNTNQEIQNPQPLNLDFWEFYIVPTSRVNEYTEKSNNPDQKKISHNVVKRMAGEAVRWDNLRKRIDEVIDQM